ncbi:MAG: T9SS type A sorting domain-containing protein [Bacteroidia bacterium]|nr:T9SS type A sorting domain-containing protein [Bacteroidia bacterium]
MTIPTPNGMKAVFFPSILMFLFLGIASVLQAQDTLYGPAPVAYTNSSHLVSASVFYWYGPVGGQLSGPWVPVEGRVNWTGLPVWWESQVRQIMAANIDIMYVHLMPYTEEVRLNLFRALSAMRAKGYDVPKVAPFLDPLITWDGKPNIDVATTEGKDSLAAQYIRFYTQYFTFNTDAYADDYIAKIEGKPILDTWHVFLNVDNVDSLKKSDLSSRLSLAFGQTHPFFNNGIHMVTTALNFPIFSFSDERVAQFEINNYFHATTFNNIKSVQLKAGYWDQNIRNPGDFLPRDGGVHYADAWALIDSSVNRIYVESWNEYDEGTGIYAGSVAPPFIKPGSGNTNTDTWSSSNDPYEYIKTTSVGAALFNDYPVLDAKFLRHTIPSQMNPNEQAVVYVTTRNEGTEKWSSNSGVSLRQDPNDAVIFSSGGGVIDDAMHEIPLFGGIFRGRPIEFELQLSAPLQVGKVMTHWYMIKDGVAFGDTLALPIEVSGFPVSITDQVVKQAATLSQNKPNPAADHTIIPFSVDAPSHLSISLLDLMGKEVRVLAEGSFGAGDHEVSVDISTLASGMYIYLLRVEGGSSIRRRLMVE